MTARILHVWWEESFVGDLAQDEHGDLSFRYDESWLAREDTRPLSRSLPLQSATFSRRECRPFFAGLLPEADQRKLVAGALGVSEANDFALLDGIGGDVAGAITLLPGPAVWMDVPYEPAAPIADDELARILDELPKRPLLAGEEGLRLSLAGAQAKLPVLLADDRPALPGMRQPTTHIIKPEIRGYEGSVENEAWCMQLAAQVGLDVAPAEARVVHDRSYLLVTRFDRVVDGDMIRRIHQEDACQALGIAPDRKYASEGGPAFRDMFELARSYARTPAVDIIKLVDAAIFNMIIGNADAHGKNFSFLLDERGPRLAPLYDLLSTIDWPQLATRMAMRIGGREGAGTLDELNRHAWERFAADAGVTFPFLRNRVGRLTGRVIASAKATTAVTERLAERARVRAAAVRQSI